MIDAGIDGDEVTATLSELGVAASDIELVCITHVDRDHVAGLLLQIGDGELAYPNAKYAIDTGLWGELHKLETYDNLPKHLRRLFQRLKELIEDRVILCDGESEFADGITFIPCPGHRPGHGAYEFATDEYMSYLKNMFKIKKLQKRTIKKHFKGFLDKVILLEKLKNGH